MSLCEGISHPRACMPYIAVPMVKPDGYVEVIDIQGDYFTVKAGGNYEYRIHTDIHLYHWPSGTHVKVCLAAHVCKASILICYIALGNDRDP